jgi:hypothetical protein
MKKFTIFAFVALLSTAAFGQTPLQSAATANGNGTTLNVSGAAVGILTVNCATCSGGTTVNFEGTEDGTNWIAVPAIQFSTGTVASSTTTAGVTIWQLPLSGLQLVRSSISAYSAGTVTVTAHTSAAPWHKLTTTASVPISSISTSVTPGNAAANLGKAEDAAHTDGDTGVFALGVRKDNATQNTSATGDYGALSIDAYGAIFSRSDHPNRIHCTVAVSTATTIQAVGSPCAAPGAGLSIYITDIEFGTSAAAGTAADSFPTLKSGTGGTCGTATAVIWQALTSANSTVIANKTTPIKVTANSEVCWIMTTAGSKTLQIDGYIAP